MMNVTGEALTDMVHHGHFNRESKEATVLLYRHASHAARIELDAERGGWSWVWHCGRTEDCCIISC